MFRLLLLFAIFCLNLALCEYHLFKVATFKSNDRTALFRRSGAPNCSDYVQQDDPEIALFLDDHYKKWIISEDFRIKDNEIDPTCKKRSLIKWYYAYYDLHNLELCNTTSGYKLVGVTSMTMSGKNCEERLKELVENENEYVFYSTSGWHNPRCQFAYFGEVKLIRSDSASLSVHHKRCREDQKLNTSEVFSEENDTDAVESQTLVFGSIGLSATVLVGLAKYVYTV